MLKCLLALINVKIPTVVGILTFMSRINFSFCRAEHKKFYNLQVRLTYHAYSLLSYLHLGKGCGIFIDLIIFSSQNFFHLSKQTMKSLSNEIKCEAWCTKLYIL